MKRATSLRRNDSRKSLTGLSKDLAAGGKDKYHGNDLYSAFYTPIPTKGHPTEILADRFSGE